MELEIFTDFEQGSDDWFKARLGIPTASVFSTVMAKGKGGGESITRRKLMLNLIGEQMTGKPAPGYSNKHMERGHEMEPDARALYAMLKDVEPQQVAFLRRGRVGASPDSLVGNDGMLEIKTKQPDLHLEAFLARRLPPEHKAQCQGQLWVAQREWLDFVSYWPGLPPLIVRVDRDEPYIATIKKAVDDFLSEMDDLIYDIRVAA